MFKVIESNGKRFELTVNAATALVYKQVFKKEVAEELQGFDLESLRGFNQLSQEEKTKLALKKQKELLDLVDLWIKLGFIMTIQGKPFAEYWNRITYDDYVEWRSTVPTSTLMRPEFITAVATLWTEDQKGSSEAKN